MQVRHAAIILQTGWRALQARLELRKLKAVVVIQKHARGMAVRSRQTREHSAATVIQVSRVCQGLIVESLLI